MVITEDDKEYELIPMSPIRRLERRMERVEKTSGGGHYPKDLLDDVVDIVRMNQMLVDELAKSNDALRIELSKLPGRLDELVTGMKELLSYIKAAGEQETTGLTSDGVKPIVDKLDEMVKTNKKISERNDTMIELLDDVGKKLRRSSLRPRPHMVQQQKPLPLKI
jgi:hypothetical protein